MTTVKILQALMLALALGVVAAMAHAQAPPGVETTTYVNALAIKDATKRAQALEVFIAWYPHSPLRVEASEQAMMAWQNAGSPDKADAIAVRLLKVDADNLRALANRAYVGRTRAMAGDAAALPVAVAAAERGFATLPKWSKPASLSDAEFVRVKSHMAAVFEGTLAFAALQAKQYDQARQRYLRAIAVDPDNLPDVYQLSVTMLEPDPCDPVGFWYAARAIAIARSIRNEATANEIDNYARAHYSRYHGGEDGWPQIVAMASTGSKAPPPRFAKSISKLMTPAAAAVQAVEDTDPAQMTVPEWALVLAQRDESEANRVAADRVWKAIVDRQKGGTRLKIPIKVVSAKPDRLEGALSERNRASNTADVVVSMALPLTPLPTVGVTISVVGSLSDYQLKPFLFRMTRAELAEESLPVAGGACADPRPQMCTRDYRPTCGIRRDGSRQTYGNACTACADPEVVTQGAGPCP